MKPPVNLSPPPADHQVFRHDFGNGVSCEYLAPTTKPDPPQSFQPVFKWTGQPTKEMLRPYIAWINSVNQHLSNLWNVRLIHTFQIGPDQWMPWIYEPGKPPKPIKPPRQ